MHEVARELVDGFLGGQVGAVEVVDATVVFIGGEEGAFDVFVRHAADVFVIRIGGESGGKTVFEKMLFQGFTSKWASYLFRLPPTGFTLRWWNW